MRVRGLLLTAALLVSFSATTGAHAASAVAVVQGTTYRTMMFPNDALTVPDPSQLTGRRLNFRLGPDYPPCTATNISACDVFTQLNRLDGFDLQPRVTIPFSGPIDVSSVNDSDVFIQGPGGRSALAQLVWDPAANTLAGISNAFLHENSTYSLVVTSFVRDTAGNPVNACGGSCVVTFTTRTASAELDGIRRALDSGSAYSAAGIGTPASRRLSFTQGGTNEVFIPALVQPSVAAPTTGMVRLDQSTIDPTKHVASTVPNLINPASARAFAFGSFAAPRYQYRSADYHQDDPNGLTDGEIPMIPSTQTAQPFGADTLGVVLVLPATPAPAGGYPVAIYGPGFTRSKLDIFVTADENAALGIATLATDPAGHAYGPNSQLTITQGPLATTLKTFGRGLNLNGDGLICDGLNDGVSPVAHVTGINASATDCAHQSERDAVTSPLRKPIDGLRSGLMQTVIDNMSLARTIALGVDVPTVGNDILSHTNISYYGLSFGGIYGTMLMGADPSIRRGLLNVPGGPIVDIARLSGFRGNLRDNLRHGSPDTRNGGPGLDGFTESIPLRADPPMTRPAPGAILLQELFGSTNWYDRPGSPETFAPLLRDRPLPGATPKDLIFQTAFGDHTVPNPTAGIIYRAGNLFDVVTVYRNDHSVQGATSDPHGWLADPTIDARARTAGQLQMGLFLKDGTRQDPNTFAPAYPGHGPLFETPVKDISNLSCLHYADPETGGAYKPTLDEPDCPLLAIDQHPWLGVLALDTVSAQARQHLDAPASLPNSGAGPSPTPGLLLGSVLLVAGLAGVGRIRTRGRRSP